MPCPRFVSFTLKFEGGDPASSTGFHTIYWKFGSGLLFWATLYNWRTTVGIGDEVAPALYM